jgi:hypothetical protein
VEEKVPQEHASCPSRALCSPWKVDLDRFADKLVTDPLTSSKFADVSVYDVIEEYRKMLYLMQLYPTEVIVPSPLVDLVWHSHILDTMAYFHDCEMLFGKYAHHKPSFGGQEEKEELAESFQAMIERYVDVYGKPAPTHVWATGGKEKRQVGGCCNGAGTGCVGCSGYCNFARSPCPYCPSYVPHT